MATVLKKLLDGEITFETFIERLLRSRRRKIEGNVNDAKEPEINITEFIPFFLNYLREQTNHHLLWRQNVPTPKKSRSNTRKQDINHNTSTNISDQETPHKNSSRGLNFTSPRTPSPNVSHSSSHGRRDRQHGKGQSPKSSPSLRRKSPRVTPSNQIITQTPSPLAVQPKPNLDDLEDFPTIGSISTPKSKSTPKRRITPTPVKAIHDTSSSPFSPTTFVSPQSGDSILSPTSLQEERTMLKAMKSRRRSKGDSPWGNKSSPNNNSSYRSPSYSVLGDYITCSTPGSSQKTKSGQTVNGEVDSSGKAKPLNQSKQQQKNIEIINRSENDATQWRNCNGSLEQDHGNSVQIDGIKKQAEKDESDCNNLPARMDVLNNSITSMVELGKVTHKEKIHLLGKLHATLVKESLLPNITSEVYFIAQLLTTRAPAVQQTEKESDLSSIDNFLYSIHNAVYFAVVILENLERVICLLDKGTLRQLALNARIAEFSPTFKEWLDQKYEEHSTPKALDLSITSPIGGVPFSADRDNKNNFPSDKAFQNFRKQRDLFYELVREWEDCHNKPGWAMEENMGNKIRSLVHQRPDLANHAPFARLFQSQLLQMCKGENVSSDPNGALARLRNANPDKFQRLQDRFVTPLSLAGPCPPPSFSEIQEFFKGFIICAESHSFSRHLMDNLIMKITELNDTVFPFGEAKDQEKNPQTKVFNHVTNDVISCVWQLIATKEHRWIKNHLVDAFFIQVLQSATTSITKGDRKYKEIQQSFSACLSSLRILAKFLGYLVFEPYQGGTSQSKQAAEPVIRMRNKVPQPFDVRRYLKTALEKGHLVLTVPWVVEYLSMMDPVAPYLDYYHEVLISLVHIYSFCSSQVSIPPVTYSHLLIITCLGWLFENPILPESLFFKSFEERSISEEILQTRLSVCLDSCDVVDQEMLYAWCPYLGEVKGVLSEASTGMSSRAGPVKKITPVSTEQPTQLSSSKRQLLQQLEENFYRIQPDFLKRTSEFIIERLCSNILSGIKTSIVPGALKKGAEQMEAYLASIGFPDDDNSDHAKEKSRPQVLQLIHSVTSDAVKKALEITENSGDTSLKAFQILCPEDTNPKVIITAAQLTARHVKQKSSDWIHLSLASMVEKHLFNHFDKFTNALLHAKAKEARLRRAVEHADDHANVNTEDKRNGAIDQADDHGNMNTKDDKMDGATLQTTPEAVLRKHTQSLKILLVNQTRQLSQASSTDDIQDIASTLKLVSCDLTPKKLSVEAQGVYLDLGNVSVELAFILACRCSCGMDFLSSENGITRTLLKMWTFLKDSGHPAPLHQLLSSPRLRLLSTLEDPQITWSVLSNLCASAIHDGLVTTHNVEQWFLKLLDATNDQSIAFGCCKLLESYRRQDTKQKSTGVEFSLLMATLSKKFSQDPDVLTSIRRCIMDSGSSITLPTI